MSYYGVIRKSFKPVQLLRLSFKASEKCCALKFSQYVSTYFLALIFSLYV